MKTAIYRIRKKEQVTYTDAIKTLAWFISLFIAFLGALKLIGYISCFLG